VTDPATQAAAVAEDSAELLEQAAESLEESAGAGEEATEAAEALKEAADASDQAAEVLERRARRKLRRSNPTGKGYTRVRSGSGFSYRDWDGATVRDRALRERFESLAIPPAWTDVWIAPHENGHIQAIGVDAQGRKQYRYHPAWREKNDRKKYERALRLAESLPAARRQVTRHLRLPGLPRKRVLAAAFRMLDEGGLRVGSSKYAEENGSRGLTTLRCSDVTIDGDTLEFRFPAKSNKEWHSVLHDADLAAVLGELQRRGPDAVLLAYQDEDQDGEWRTLTPQDVNRYVKRRTGARFTAKDFRTLRGTVTAAASLAKHGPEPTKGKRKRAVAQAMRDAAEVLSNTPTIAKSSYVDPRLVDHYASGETIDPERLNAAEAEVRQLLVR
jgi:DNA topoisomerase-1